MKFSQALTQLLQGKDLSLAQSDALFQQLLLQKLEPPKAKSILLLLAHKGETADEVLGCVRALRRLEPVLKTSVPRLMDTCGTGGDGSHSLNISTLAALVIAGAGGKVAKHGNRGLSSRCGSSDVLEALGVNLKTPSSKIIQSIRKNGIGYFHAPFHHPVFAKMQPLRQSLKTRTLFNLLGPLVNPLAPSYQLVGVASKKVFELYIQIFKKLKTTALICHSNDGMDEISVSAPTQAAWIQQGKVKRFVIHPENYFKGPQKLIPGGSPKKNAGIARNILSGKKRGAARNIVVLNAAAGLRLSDKASSLKEGIKKANQAIDAGKASQALLGLSKDQS